MTQYTIVDGDDWTGLYVDGRLVTEGHDIPLDELLFAVREHGPVTSIERVEACQEWLELEGRLPAELADVKGTSWQR